MTDTEYWDNVAKEASRDGLHVRDNFMKRQLLVRELLDYEFNNKQVLEVGVGCGVTAGALKVILGWNFKYSGTDLSAHFCSVAHKLFNHSTVQARITELPFSGEQFDCLFLFDVLEHVKPEERQLAYSELSRVLKESATVFINNPMTESKHDPDFDYGFSDLDIATMSRQLGMRIEKIKILGTQGHIYQFVVMSR